VLKLDARDLRPSSPIQVFCVQGRESFIAISLLQSGFERIRRCWDVAMIWRAAVCLVYTTDASRHREGAALYASVSRICFAADQMTDCSTPRTHGQGAMRTSTNPVCLSVRCCLSRPFGIHQSPSHCRKHAPSSADKSPRRSVLRSYLKNDPSSA